MTTLSMTGCETHEAVTRAGQEDAMRRGPDDNQRGEINGVISEADGKMNLVCRAYRHKVGELYPDGTLILVDRRCKHMLVFRLTRLAPGQKEE